MKAGNKNSALDGVTRQVALALDSDRLDVNGSATTPISCHRPSAVNCREFAIHAAPAESDSVHGMR